jgi:hypothetical protein
LGVRLNIYSASPSPPTADAQTGSFLTGKIRKFTPPPPRRIAKPYHLNYTASGEIQPIETPDPFHISLYLLSVCMHLPNARKLQFNPTNAAETLGNVKMDKVVNSSISYFFECPFIVSSQQFSLFVLYLHRTSPQQTMFILDGSIG